MRPIHSIIGHMRTIINMMRRATQTVSRMFASTGFTCKTPLMCLLGINKSLRTPYKCTPPTSNLVFLSPNTLDRFYNFQVDVSNRIYSNPFIFTIFSSEHERTPIARLDHFHNPYYYQFQYRWVVGLGRGCKHTIPYASSTAESLPVCAQSRTAKAIRKYDNPSFSCKKRLK